MAQHIPVLMERLRVAMDEVARIEQAHDLAHVSGAYAAAQRVVRQCQDALVQALAQEIVDECDRLAAIEPIARDAMAHAEGRA